MSLEHGTITAREIREVLRGNIDPKLGRILVRLAEDQRDSRRILQECVQTIAHIMDAMNGLFRLNETLSRENTKLKSGEAFRNRVADIKGEKYGDAPVTSEPAKGDV
jgi:hypothetical protein